MTPRFSPPPEKQVQAQVVALFRAAGGIVKSTSQYRASHVAPGLPDLKVFFPAIERGLWFEVKSYRPQGFDPLRRWTWEPRALEPAQEAFRTLCLVCKESYFWGGLAQAEDMLVLLGLATREKGHLTLRQRAP